MYLIVSDLKKYWPLKDEMITLTRSLKFKVNQKKKNNSILSSTSDEFLPPNFHDNTYNEIFEIYEEVLKILAQRLNKIHHKEYPIRYWKTLIGFWLLDYITYIYNYYKRINILKKKYKNLKIYNSEINKDTILINDYNGFLKIAGEDKEFNQIIAYEICSKCGVVTIDKYLNTKKFKNRNSDFIRKSKILTSFIYGLFEKILSLRAKAIIYVSDFPKIYYLLLPIISFGKIAFFRTRRLVNEHYRSKNKNLKLRKFISKREENFTNTSNLILYLLEICMPSAFLEDFMMVNSYVHNNFGRHKPKLIFSTNSWWSDHAFCLWAATNREKGTKTVSGLHAPPAIFNCHRNFFENEIANTDYYLNWSKQKISNSNILPVASNKLIRAEKKIKRNSNLILFMSTIKPTYQYRSLEDFSEYIKDQIKILNKFPSQVFNFTEVRLNNEDFGWELKKILTNNVQNIKFNNNKNEFYREIVNSKLCVFDYLGTTAFESLVLNVPSIIYVNETNNQFIDVNKSYSQYEIVGDLRKDLEILKDVEILHTNIDSLINCIIKNYSNINSWWNEQHRQKAIQDFTNKYFYKSNNPLKEWKKILHFILDNSSHKT